MSTRDRGLVEELSREASSIITRARGLLCILWCLGCGGPSDARDHQGSVRRLQNFKPRVHREELDGRGPESRNSMIALADAWAR